MYRFFKKRREAVKKYLLIFFLSIVSIGMVITLAPLPSLTTDNQDANVLASIGGVNITIQNLQQSIQSRFRNSPLGSDPRLIPAVAGGVLEDMVLQRALVKQASKMGIEVTNQELYRALESIPWLYPGGNFVGVDQARDLVQQQAGMSLQQFESLMRENLLQQKLRATITDGVQVTPQEVQEEFRRENAKVKIEYVVFDPSQFLKAVQVSPQALEAFFKKDPSRYKLPEERQVRYVLITPDQLRAQATPSEAQLRDYYTQHLSDYRVPDRVKVAQILFKTTGKSQHEIAAIDKTAQDVLNQLKNGASFAEMAKRYSEDASAADGGEVGWIVRGQTVKEFENAAFSLKPGQISGLIKTSYGVQIIKVEDKQVAHLQSFDEVKDSIRDQLEKQSIAAAQSKLATNLEAQLKATPQQFDAIVRKAGLDPMETPLFKYGQAVPDLGNNDSFENLSFQLRQDEVGQPITVPKGVAIIQVTQIVPEHIPTLDEVRARVEEDYRASQSKVLAEEKAKQFAQEVKSGDFQKVARSMGLTVKDSKDFTRQDYVEGLASASDLNAAFTLQPGQSSDVLQAGGNSIVLHVVSHTPANEADFAQQRDRVAEQLLQQKRNLMFEIYRQNLMQELERSGDVKFNQSALKQFIASYQQQP